MHKNHYNMKGSTLGELSQQQRYFTPQIHYYLPLLFYTLLVKDLSSRRFFILQNNILLNIYDSDNSVYLRCYHGNLCAGIAVQSWFTYICSTCSNYTTHSLHFLALFLRTAYRSCCSLSPCWRIQGHYFVWILTNIQAV